MGFVLVIIGNCGHWTLFLHPTKQQFLWMVTLTMALQEHAAKGMQRLWSQFRKSKIHVSFSLYNSAQALQSATNRLWLQIVSRDIIEGYILECCSYKLSSKDYQLSGPGFNSRSSTLHSLSLSDSLFTKRWLSQYKIYICRKCFTEERK